MVTSEDSIRSELKALGIVPSKGRGQNFLTSPHIAASICAFSGVAKEDTVLEIGPGLGVLTEPLLNTAKRVIAAEIEENFATYLREKLAHYNNLTVLSCNVLKLSCTELNERYGPRIAVVSNLPYSISTDVIFFLLNNRRSFSSATLLLQKEFAERLAAEPGGRTYGSISVQCALYAKCRLGPVVGAESFYPAPEVESRVVRLEFRDRPRVELADPIFFERVVRAAFGARRKTLLNSLTRLGGQYAKDVVKSALEEARIDAQRRAETLSVEEFSDLAQKLLLKTSD